MFFIPRHCVQEYSDRGALLRKSHAISAMLAPHFSAMLCTCIELSKKMEAYCLNMSTDSVVRNRQVPCLVQRLSISG